MPSNQRQIIEQAKFAYSPFGKAFIKQAKTIVDQGKKQVEILEVLKPEKNQKQKNQLKAFFQKKWELLKLKMK